MCKDSIVSFSFMLRLIGVRNSHQGEAGNFDGCLLLNLQCPGVEMSQNSFAPKPGKDRRKGSTQK